MVEQWTFDSTDESWTWRDYISEELPDFVGATFGYYASDGSPANGSLRIQTAGDNAYAFHTASGVYLYARGGGFPTSPTFTALGDGDYTVSFRVRAINNGTSGYEEYFRISVYLLAFGYVFDTDWVQVATGGDSGWVTYNSASFTVSGGTHTSLEFDISLAGDNVGTIVAAQDWDFRLDTISISATSPRLYTGTNSLTERSNLPSGFTGLYRGALCVRADSTAVVGCNVSNSTMIATAGSGDSYATWTDITDSHPQGVTKSIVEV